MNGAYLATEVFSESERLIVEYIVLRRTQRIGLRTTLPFSHKEILGAGDGN